MMKKKIYQMPRMEMVIMEMQEMIAQSPLQSTWGESVPQSPAKAPRRTDFREWEDDIDFIAEWSD